ncbi:tetratricopeptide repeat-containing glycosyltransferase family 2 protein [Enterococcus diestrammenae]|uniref:Glycosyltransferase 2-like domain-containing protein n=1 Tax=Enterococcus diestrammenae TaxID=1155073 RepID=A0ABV0F1R4_9ENTE|nr:glycosyltransferase family 2 protein [Enterococcus diestrammenae]KAF1298807.1 hypothetical protein BAU18_06065 [Enterococcus diestrammenae]
MTISCCILAKNEEKNLKDCLPGIQSCFEEIIVIDNSSVDNTREICEKFGAKVYDTSSTSEPYRRNLFFEKAKSDWILSIDADERLTPENILEIKNQIEQADKDVFGFRIPINNYFGGMRWSQNLQLKLFRNDDRLCFDNYQVHTSIGNSIISLNKRIDKLNYSIHHLDGIQRTRNKNKRSQYTNVLVGYYPLEKHTRVLNYLAVELITERKFSEAIELLEKIISIKNKDSFLAQYYLGECYLLMGRYDYSMAVFESLLQLNSQVEMKKLGYNSFFGNDAEIISDDLKQRSLSKMCEIHVQNGNFQKAFETCEKAIAFDPNGAHHYLNKASLLADNDFSKQEFYSNLLIAYEKNPFLYELIKYPVENENSQYYHQSVVLSLVSQYFEKKWVTYDD